MLEKGIVEIGDEILEPVFKFLEYCLLGSFSLNALAAGHKPGEQLQVTGSRKRKRIVQRMARGLTPQKRRRFSISKIKESLQCFSSEDIEQQLAVLVSHVIIEKPTRKSISMVRNLSLIAESYLKTHCLYTTNEIVGLKRMMSELT